MFFSRVGADIRTLKELPNQNPLLFLTKMGGGGGGSGRVWKSSSGEFQYFVPSRRLKNSLSLFSFVLKQRNGDQHKTTDLNKGRWSGIKNPKSFSSLFGICSKTASSTAIAETSNLDKGCGSSVSDPQDLGRGVGGSVRTKKPK